MRNIYIFLIVTVFLYTYAAAGNVYVNPQKTAKEINADETECNGQADAQNLKDAEARQNKVNQCMQDKGYKSVPEKDAARVKGFKEAWVNPDVDFKAYEIIFIDKVDVSQVKVKNMKIPGTKVTDQNIDDLGEQMLKRFSKILSILMPVVHDKKEIVSKKALCVELKLKDIAQTNVGVNVLLQGVGMASGVPIPVSSQGLFSFEGVITDFATKEKLLTVSDEAKSDKNASIIGTEGFSKWKHAYNTMDYWADCLAKLLASKRGQKYKPQTHFKLIGF